MSVSHPPIINETQLNPSTFGEVTSKSASVNQPLLERSGPKPENQKIYKRYKWGIGISGVCLIIFLIIGIAGPFIIEATINSLIGKQTVLGKDNYGVWGQLPGDAGTDFVRQFSFFNFSNWQDFILHGNQPQFTEVQGYKISQVQDYIDLDWKENDEVVGVKSWLRFAEKKDSKSLDDTVVVLNAGSLGFWDTIKNSDPALVLNQGLGITFLNIQVLIKNIIIGMTISSQFLPDFQTAWAALYQPADIQRENAIFIWNDPSHGMSSSGTLNEWILASQKGPTSKQAQNLGNYFTLSSSQLTSLIFSFTAFYQASNQLVMSNYYCYGDSSCSGFDLAIKQFASMGVTYNPPPSKTIEPNPSICNLNVSCKNYYVEISAYYNFVFLHEEHQQKYKNLTFKESIVRSWFYHDGDNINKNQSSILHLGNLKALLRNGTQYDNNVSNEGPLQNIRIRFNLQTKQHAYVFWNWIKYYYNQYINRARQGGKTAYTASALFGTQFFYQSWAKTLDRLHILLLKYKLKQMLSGMSCSELFSQSMRIPDQAVNQLCGKYNIRNLDNIQKLILVCKYKYNDEWKVMDKIVKSSLAMEQFCDRTQEDGFSGALQKAEIYLDQFYGCHQTPLPYCSDYELAVKQWTSSNVTRNPIPQMIKDFQPVNTIHDWFDDIRPFEYGYWLTKFPNETLPSISMKQGYRFMSHDNLFSLNTWQQVWLETNKTELVQRYGIYHQEQMGKYLRYVVVYVTFDGFAKERKVRDLLFGYTDPLVDYIVKRSPLIGGDPSRPSFIHLNDLNLTQEQAQNYPLQIHTGKNYPERTSYIKAINGKETINFNTSEWNGNETVQFTESPWKQQVQIIGSDGKQSAPKQHQQPFNVSIFVPAAQRTVFANYTGQNTQKFGLKINKFTINDTFFQSEQQNPDNAKYYQKLPGFVNLSKIYSFPIFASKNHFYGLDSNWTDLIDIWNEGHQWKYKPSKYDDSYFYIEPYSGVTFQANVYLMLSYYYQPDNIFKTEGARMLPIFNILQSGNFTQSGANKLLGTLRTGLGSKIVIFWVGIVLSILLLISMVLLYIMLRKRMSHDKKKQSLIVVEEDDMEREVV